METLLAFIEACANAAMRPRVEGQPRELRVTAGVIALLIAASTGGWLIYKMGSVEEKVDKAASGVERLENALIHRGAAAAMPASTPKRPRDWVNRVELIPQAGAGEHP